MYLAITTLSALQPIRFVAIAISLGIIGGLAQYIWLLKTHGAKKIQRDDDTDIDVSVKRLIVLELFAFASAITVLTYIGETPSNWESFVRSTQSLSLTWFFGTFVLVSAIRFWHPVTHDLRSRRDCASDEDSSGS